MCRLLRQFLVCRVCRCFLIVITCCRRTLRWSIWWWIVFLTWKWLTSGWCLLSKGIHFQWFREDSSFCLGNSRSGNRHSIHKSTTWECLSCNYSMWTTCGCSTTQWWRSNVYGGLFYSREFRNHQTSLWVTMSYKQEDPQLHWLS